MVASVHIFKRVLHCFIPIYFHVCHEHSTKIILSTWNILSTINKNLSIIILRSDETHIYLIISLNIFTAIGSTKIQENGVGVASSVLQLQVSRNELGATFTCRVSSLALADPLTDSIRIDVHGKYVRILIITKLIFT